MPTLHDFAGALEHIETERFGDEGRTLMEGKRFVGIDQILGLRSPVIYEDNLILAGSGFFRPCVDLLALLDGGQRRPKQFLDPLRLIVVVLVLPDDVDAVLPVLADGVGRGQRKARAEFVFRAGQRFHQLECDIGHGFALARP